MITTVLALLPLADAAPPPHPLADPGLRADQEDPESAWRDFGWSVGTNSEGQVVSSVWINQQEPVEGAVPPPDASPVVPLLGADLEALLTGSEVPGTVEVVLSTHRLDWRPFPSVQQALQVAMLAGSVSSPEDERTIRHGLRAEWQEAGAQAIAPIVEAVGVVGGDVTDTSRMAGQVFATVPTSTVTELLAHPSVVRVSLDVPMEPDNEGYGMNVFGDLLNGDERDNLLQTTPFHNDGYLGNDDEIIVYEGEADNTHNGHPGLWRHTNCTSFSSSFPNGCVDTFLTGNLPWVNGRQHATATASIIAGNILNGEDSTIGHPVDRRRRSGVAPEAFTLGVDGYGAADAVVASFAHDPHLLNMSARNGANCTGLDPADQDANALFENGVAFIKSASNRGNGGGTTCTVGRPAAAIGTFVVTAYGIDTSGDAAIISGSSRGGATDGRSIIDVAAPTRHQYAYPYYQWPNDTSGTPFRYGTQWNSSKSNSTPAGYGRTSGATPGITGAAALVREWWHDTYGTAIDDPAMLYTNLLLMADRTAESGSLTVGYDDRWGAGKFHARQYDLSSPDPGMEAPAAFGASSLCVNHGMNTSAMFLTTTNSDVDILRVTAWWYDSTHDSGTNPHAKVDMKLYQDTGSFLVLEEQSATDDNKQRIHVASPTSTAWRLRFTGRDVRSDVDGCGTNGVRVYYAWYAESTDRAGSVLPGVRPE